MRKFLTKIDYTLLFRLLLSIAMCSTGYIQNDRMAGIFGLFLAVFAIISAKYKIGCGYGSCMSNTKFKLKEVHSEQVKNIDINEVK